MNIGERSLIAIVPFVITRYPTQEFLQLADVIIPLGLTNLLLNNHKLFLSVDKTVACVCLVLSFKRDASDP